MPKPTIKSQGAIVSIALMIVLLCLTALMCVNLIPLLKEIEANVADERAILSVIQNLGAKGVLIIMTLQALQVITTVFPSAPIQILAGLSYGIFNGMLICLAGYMLGNTIVFVLVRQVDKTIAFIASNPKKQKRTPKWDLSFLRSSNNAALMAFSLFLIPGIPNGILPYIFAKTKISLPRYLLSIFLAGVPSILLCNLVGERLSSGHIFTAALIIILLISISIYVIISRKRIIAFLKKFTSKDSEL